MDINDVGRFMDYRSHFDGMDSDLSPNSRDSNETGSSASPPQSVTFSPRTFHELGIMSYGEQMEEQFSVSFALTEPYLRVVEEPVEKFRFRYLSEVTGVHGAITGRKCKKTNKTSPSVQLVNWNGPAWIRCSLYTGQPDTTLRTPSCHQLVVKGVSENVGTLTLPVNDGVTGDTARFAGMAIINTSNKDKVSELRNKLQARQLEENLRMGLAGRRLNLKEQSAIEAQAKKLAKDTSLSNTVSLFFECFDEEMRPICKPVFSGVIANQKSALTNQLKISRIDKHVSSCLGKEEVFMLVEKVNKKHIKVRFFEVDDEDQVIWSDYASFTELDVHYQYAIVFKTPPYRLTDIEESVNVFVELERTTDGARSKPLDFQYRPCEKQATRLRKKARKESPQELDVTLNGDDPMLCKGFQADVAYEEPAYVSTTQSIEAVFNAPLLPEYELAEIITEFSDNTWDDLVIDSSGAGKKKGSSLLRKNLEGKPRAAEAKKDAASGPVKFEFTEGDLLRKVLQGCETTTKRRSDVTSGLTDAFQRLCSLQNSEGSTAFHIAVENEDLATLTTLTREVAACRCTNVLDFVNDNNETALHLATCLYAPAMVAALVSAGASLAPTNLEGRTAAHLAVELGHDECLAAMLGSGGWGKPGLETRDDHGLTALHLAVIRGNVSAVRKLYAAGAKPATIGRNGETALHLAAQEAQVDIARFLVEEAMVRVDVDDISGITPMDIAKAKGCRELVQLLAAAGGKLSVVDESESDSDADFEDAESGPEIKSHVVKTEGIVVKTERLDSVSSISEETMQRLCDFLDESSRWKRLAEKLDFEFLISGIDAENIGSPGKTLISFADMNGVGVYRLRTKLSTIADPDTVAAIFDL